MAERKYLIFKLNEEKYGFDIMTISEVSEYRKPSNIPNAPYFIDGVINLRGSVIPVINMKKKFHMPESEVSELNKIIIASVDDKPVGIHVDEASQVITIRDEEIQAPPDIITSVGKKNVTGVVKLEEDIIMLLNLHELFAE